MVIIIDEVHNIKSIQGKEGAIVPPILESIIEYGENNKLVLMTATPMYNTSSEIIYLLNLLRLNDKKSKINPN